MPVAAPGLGLRGRPWRRGLRGDMETVSELELGAGVLWQAPGPKDREGTVFKDKLLCLSVFGLELASPTSK